MASPFSYQIPNWREGTPFAEENTLLQGMNQDPVRNAGNFLMMPFYEGQRAHNQYQYDQELQNQHAFAQLALAQHTQAQQREDLIKYLNEVGGKNANAIQLAQGNQLLSPLFAGSEAGTTEPFSQQTYERTSAENFKNIAEGLNKAREGGFQVPTMDATRITGSLGVPFASVLPTAVEAQLARAGVDADKVHVGYTGQVDATGNPITFSRTVPSGQAPAAGAQLREMGKRPPSYIGGAVPPAPGGTSAQPPTSTSVRPQSTAPVAGQQLADPDMPGYVQAHTAAMLGLDALKAKDPDMHSEVMQYFAKEGRLPIVVIPGAGFMLGSPSGKTAAIPNISSARGTMR